MPARSHHQVRCGRPRRRRSGLGADALDRLTQQETPDGLIDYTYHLAGRRATMTVDGQTAVSYSYDAANRLTGVTQGSASVTIAYDAANRRTALTLPNGVVTEYAYDTASQLASLTTSCRAPRLAT